MSDGYPIQTNFTSGEVSPLIRGRVDVNKYFNGAEIIENFLVRPQGGLCRRSGTRFVNEVQNSDRFTRIYKFEFSALQAYVIEFGHLYIRIHKDGGTVEVTGVPVEVVSPYNENQLRGLYFTQSADVLYICHPDHPTQKLVRLSHTSWSLSEFITQDGPYLDKNVEGISMVVTNVVNIGTLVSTNPEFAAPDVGTYVEYYNNGRLQIGLILSLVDANTITITPYENVVDPQTIDPTAVVDYAALSGAFPNRLRSSKSIWSSKTENSYIKIGAVWYKVSTHIAQTEDVTPLFGQHYSADLMTVDSQPAMHAVVGTITLTDQSITGVLTCSFSKFEVRDINRHIRFDFSGTQLWATITSVTSDKIANIELGRMIPLSSTDPTKYINNGRTTNWRLGAWYLGNYPSCVTFHEERITFAATYLQPQTLWTSMSADYETFSPTDTDGKVLDNNAITYTIASSQINKINWLMSGPVLLIGTSGAEWQSKASTLQEAITPTNLSVLPQTGHGSSATARPELVGSAVLFVQRSGNKLRELVYDFQLDRFVAKDLTIIAEHIFRKHDGALEVAYQQEPNSIMWAVTEDGTLTGMTYEKDQEVVAWHNHILGGAGVAVESITCVPSEDGKSDTLYLVVKRTIDGRTRRYIELLEKDFWPNAPTDKIDMFFVDSGLTYSGAPTNSVTGLFHLEGQQVAVCADGSVRSPSSVVAGGSIVFDGEPASTVHAGLAFNSVYLSLPLEAGADKGTAQGKTKRINRLIVRVLNSIGFKHGPSLEKLETVSFRTASGAMDQSPSFKTTDVPVSFDSSYDLTAQFYLVQDSPYPLNVIAIMPQEQTYK
jgi:hypothetical protein